MKHITHLLIMKKTFEEMIEEGKRRRLLEGGIAVWTNEYESRLLHELDVVKKMGYVDYHKVVEDFLPGRSISWKNTKNRN